MFDNLKNLNLGDLMGNMRQMQEQMQRLQEELERKTVTAEAGDGMVRATVNGKLEMVSLKIDKTRIDITDTELLEDAIVAAVRGAQFRAQQMVKEELHKAASAMGLPPGLLG